MCQEVNKPPINAMPSRGGFRSPAFAPAPVPETPRWWDGAVDGGVLKVVGWLGWDDFRWLVDGTLLNTWISRSSNWAYRVLQHNWDAAKLELWQSDSVNRLFQWDLISFIIWRSPSFLATSFERMIQAWRRAGSPAAHPAPVSMNVPIEQPGPCWFVRHSRLQLTQVDQFHVRYSKPWLDCAWCSSHWALKETDSARLSWAMACTPLVVIPAGPPWFPPIRIGACPPIKALDRRFPKRWVTDSAVCITTSRVANHSCPSMNPASSCGRRNGWRKIGSETSCNAWPSLCYE